MEATISQAFIKVKQEHSAVELLTLLTAVSVAVSVAYNSGFFYRTNIGYLTLLNVQDFSLSTLIGAVPLVGAQLAASLLSSTFDRVPPPWYHDEKRSEIAKIRELIRTDGKEAANRLTALEKSASSRLGEWLFRQFFERTWPLAAVMAAGAIAFFLTLALPARLYPFFVPAIFILFTIVILAFRVRHIANAPTFYLAAIVTCIAGAFMLGVAAYNAASVSAASTIAYDVDGHAYDGLVVRVNAGYAFILKDATLIAMPVSRISKFSSDVR